MIDIKLLRQDPQRFIDGAAAKRIEVDIPALLADEARLLEAQRELQELRTIQNSAGKKIAKLSGQEKAAAIAEMKQAKDRAKAVEDIIAQLEPKVAGLLLQVPLPPDPAVPRGQTSDDNVEVRRWNPPWFDTARPFAANKGFQPRTHIELGEMLGLLDIPRGVRMSGSRSYVLWGRLAQLHQAVLRLAFDFMVNQQGFTPVSVPVLVRDNVLVGTGFFPFGREQVYQIKETDRGGSQDLYVTGTGEAGLMGLHQDEILDGDSLPRRYVTVSTCFRREAGAAGKDTAGIYRIHQFDKVEQVVVCKNSVEESNKYHEEILANAEAVLKAFELPYRIVVVCTGDLGRGQAKKYDIETWMPSRKNYCETHSASKFYEFQARRMNLRYKETATKKNLFCHTLNNTVIASPRVLIPIMELYQNADGTITVPKVLRPYMGGKERIG